MILPLIITIALAEYAARDDFQQIGKDDKICHGIQWLFRASVVTLACWLSGTWWLAFGMAGLFSAYFRWRLNTLRGLGWSYIGPWSSIYDAAFYSFVHRVMFGKWPTVASIQQDKGWYHFFSALPVCICVHRAGTIAYIFEGLLFVGVMVYICIA